MGLHRCTEPECPFVGQTTSRSCGCHKTDEQVLTAANKALANALTFARARLAAGNDVDQACVRGIDKRLADAGVVLP